MKRFILKILIYFIPFCCVYIGYKIFQNHVSGDIGILGQYAFGKEYIQFLEKNHLPNELTLNKFVTSQKDLQNANVSKIFTIGDSFSQLGIFGYQNYLSHLLADSIINIERNETNIKTAVSLLNSEMIDSSNCHIFILEQVDRYLVEKLCKIDFEIQYKLPENTKLHNNKNANKDSVLYNLCSWIRLQYNYDNPIFKHDLKQDCFSHHRYSHTLFRYVTDFNFKNTQPADIEKAKENLILLDKKFSAKGIKLIFLIAADKYDVYRPFMTDNSLPVDTTTDGLSDLPGVCIINTKPMLQEMVRQGEKDVYMVNDTHWSYKASKAIAQKLVHTIDSLERVKRAVSVVRNTEDTARRVPTIVYDSTD